MMININSTVGLQNWILGFRPRALAQGISPATFDRAFQDLRYNDTVIGKDRNQAEFTKTIWDYLDSAVSGGGSRAGRRSRC